MVRPLHVISQGPEPPDERKSEVLPNKEHRLGVSEATLVVRHLKLQPCERAALEAALEEIDQIYGLDCVSYDERSRVLNAAYDASRICIDCIEEVLTKHGIEVGHDWWTHLKKGYYRSVDQNVKGNASRDAWSCHQLPPGAGKR